MIVCMCLVFAGLGALIENAAHSGIILLVLYDCMYVSCVFRAWSADRECGTLRDHLASAI